MFCHYHYIIVYVVACKAEKFVLLIPFVTFIFLLLLHLTGLVAKIQKNLANHTEFLNYKNEMDAWIARAQDILDECNGEGDFDQIASQLDTVNV